jgi:hypothetical protein
VPNRTGRCGWSESRCASEEVAGGFKNSGRTMPTGPGSGRRRRQVRAKSRSNAGGCRDPGRRRADDTAGTMKRRRLARWDRAGRRDCQTRRCDVVAVGPSTSRPDQKTLRWAKMAISSRVVWVGADCHARSIARFWRLIIRRCRMRSIMLMVVLTSFPGLVGLVFGARLVLNQLCATGRRVAN